MDLAESESRLAAGDPGLEKLADLVIQAGACPVVTLFPDEASITAQALQPRPYPDAIKRVDTLTARLSTRLGDLDDRRDRPAQALLARSLINLGLRIADRPSRVHQLLTGLQTASLGAFWLSRAEPELADACEGLSKGCSKAMGEVNGKLKRHLMKVDLKERTPDLVRLAQADEELAFRVEAALLLGVAKHHVKSPPLLKAIDDTLHGMLREQGIPGLAAKRALALTPEEARRYAAP